MPGDHAPRNACLREAARAYVDSASDALLTWWLEIKDLWDLRELITVSPYWYLDLLVKSPPAGKAHPLRFLLEGGQVSRPAPPPQSGPYRVQPFATGPCPHFETRELDNFLDTLLDDRELALRHTRKDGWYYAAALLLGCIYPEADIYGVPFLVPAERFDEEYAMMEADLYNPDTTITVTAVLSDIHLDEAVETLPGGFVLRRIGDDDRQRLEGELTGPRARETTQPSFVPDECEVLLERTWCVHKQAAEFSNGAIDPQLWLEYMLGRREYEWPEVAVSYAAEVLDVLALCYGGCPRVRALIQTDDCYVFTAGWRGRAGVLIPLDLEASGWRVVVDSWAVHARGAPVKVPWGGCWCVSNLMRAWARATEDETRLGRAAESYARALRADGATHAMVEVWKVFESLTRAGHQNRKQAHTVRLATAMARHFKVPGAEDAGRIVEFARTVRNWASHASSAPAPDGRRQALEALELARGLLKACLEEVRTDRELEEFLRTLDEVS